MVQGIKWSYNRCLLVTAGHIVLHHCHVWSALWHCGPQLAVSCCKVNPCLTARGTFSVRPHCVGQNSSVGIVTDYGLDSPGSNPGGGWDYPHHPDRLWGPPSLLYNGYRVFPRGKVAGAWRWPPTPTQRWGKRKSRAIPLLPLWAFLACCRVAFRFTLLLSNTADWRVVEWICLLIIMTFWKYFVVISEK